ncbi:hypothetical protein [Gottfriedia acidiceleris]|uniref:hypothetical protein n=1 Tax=Gottfriedia acidiceleris TaxID=371036 RepID=UPI0014316929|nr:hypothetical protein [Gottfriedia acidiceleris]
MINIKNIKEDWGTVQEGRKNEHAIVVGVIHSLGEVISEMKWLVTITTSYDTTNLSTV